MGKIGDFFRKLFGGDAPAPTTAPNPDAVADLPSQAPAKEAAGLKVVTGPSATPAPAPKVSKKKVPTRVEMQQLVRDLSLGKIPNRLGIPYNQIRETNGKNRSAAIDAMLRAQGGPLGAPYCQAGVQEVLDEKCRYYKINRRSVNIPEGVGTQDIWARAPKKYKHTAPLLCSWINWRHGHTGQGHTGEVISYNPGSSHMGTLEFNTSASGAGVNRDGEGAYYGLTRSTHDGGYLQINGYIDVYQAIVDAMIASNEWEM